MDIPEEDQEMATKLEFLTKNDGSSISKYFFWLMQTIVVRGKP